MGYVDENRMLRKKNQSFIENDVFFFFLVIIMYQP